MLDNDMEKRFRQRPDRLPRPTNATPALAVSCCLAGIPWAAILTVAGSLILAGLACALFAC